MPIKCIYVSTLFIYLTSQSCQQEISLPRWAWPTAEEFLDIYHKQGPEPIRLIAFQEILWNTHADASIHKVNLIRLINNLIESSDQQAAADIIGICLDAAYAYNNQDIINKKWASSISLPLCTAIKQNNIVCTRILLEKRADPNLHNLRSCALQEFADSRVYPITSIDAVLYQVLLQHQASRCAANDELLAKLKIFDDHYRNYFKDMCKDQTLYLNSLPFDLRNELVKFLPATT